MVPSARQLHQALVQFTRSRWSSNVSRRLGMLTAMPESPDAHYSLCCRTWKRRDATDHFGGGLPREPHHHPEASELSGVRVLATTGLASSRQKHGP